MKFIAKLWYVLSDVFREKDPIDLIRAITVCTFLGCICVIMILLTFMCVIGFFSWLVPG